MHFIDLDRQYELIKDNIDKGLRRVMEHKEFIMGPEVLELEEKLKEYTGCKYAFSCSSGTDALVIPLMAYELKPNDAVFLPSFTFFATGESVTLAGGTPVFIDSDQTYNMDIINLENAINATLKEGKLTPRGIITVDLFGLPAAYDEISKIADKYNLFLLEDAAQGFGGIYRGKKAGSFGDAAATSFFPAKPLGCYGDGGAIFTNNDELAEKIKSIRVHGQGKNRYDNIRIGINGRLDTLQAAVLLPKLEIFDDELNKRANIAQLYISKLKDDFVVPTIPKDCMSSWAQLSLLAKDEIERLNIIREMKTCNIPIMVYYELPLHLQSAYKYLGYKQGALPFCEDYSKRIFSIPMHPYLKNVEIDYICEKLKTIIK